jgi:hypothetical protein
MKRRNLDQLSKCQLLREYPTSWTLFKKANKIFLCCAVSSSINCTIYASYYINLVFIVFLTVLRGYRKVVPVLNEVPSHQGIQYITKYHVMKTYGVVVV